MVRLAALLGSLLIAAAPASACRLALVLAIDVSNSVDQAEDALQRQGLAAALTAPEVQAAFFVSPEPVALFVFEWSGRYHQDVVLEWTTITAPQVLTDAADTISRSVRQTRDFPTAMGYALGYASLRLLDQQQCVAKTIDVAGDGRNNDGFGPSSAYKAYPFDGVTVNGLVVDASILATRDQLIDFYESTVIRGPGAFVEVADGFADYERTMRRKLVRELLSQVVGQASGAQTPGAG